MSETPINTKPFMFYPDFEEARIIQALVARLQAQGKSGHAASRQTVMRAAINALAEKEHLLQTACAQGSGV